MEKIKISGTVIEKEINKGSKSEYTAVCIMTSSMDYILRRIGENPFNDPLLKKLLNKKIDAEGFLENNTFFLQSYSSTPTKILKKSPKVIKKD